MTVSERARSLKTGVKPKRTIRLRAGHREESGLDGSKSDVNVMRKELENIFSVRAWWCTTAAPEKF